LTVFSSILYKATQNREDNVKKGPERALFCRIPSTQKNTQEKNFSVYMKYITGLRAEKILNVKILECKKGEQK